MKVWIELLSGRDEPDVLYRKVQTVKCRHCTSFCNRQSFGSMNAAGRRSIREYLHVTVVAAMEEKAPVGSSSVERLIGCGASVVDEK
jgi:hypothetical protein